MKSPKYHRPLVRVVLLAAALSSLLRAPSFAQSTATPSGVVDDWSFHHLVYSNPGTREQAVQNGTVDKWQKITNDPRYQMEVKRRSLSQRSQARTRTHPIKKDWSQSLTSSAVAATLTGVVGALNSSSIGSGSSLTVDGVTFSASPPVAAIQTGTFASPPKAADAITVVNGGNTLTLTTNATPQTATGTFQGTIPASNTTVTIKSGANTLTLSNGGTTASYALTFSGFSSTSGQIVISYSGGSTTNTLTMTAGSSDGCTNTGSTYTGTFTSTSNSSSTRATHFNTAMGSCSGLGVTSSRNSSAITLTAALPGNFLSVPTNTLTNASGTLTAGTNGSSTCSGASSTAGTFATSNSTTTLAQNLAAAIIACNTGNSLVGATASWTSGNTFTITDTTPGPSSSFTFTLGGANDSGIFAWSGQTGGSAGSTGCSGSTTGTFATSSTLSTLAGNLNTAIGDCTAADGVTSIINGNGVKLTASTAGTGGNSITLTSTSSFFAWTSGTLTSGSDGTTSGTTFAYWSGATYISPSAAATNIATVLNANATVSAVLTAAANTPSTGDVTLTAKTAGVSANGSYQVTTSNFSAFSPTSGYLSGGAAGVQPNAYPAKYSFSTSTASCTDFVIYPTGAAGAPNAANLVAYTNLYVGTGACESANPTVDWAYNTGGTVTTSPSLSADGSQVAFMQVTGTTASLVLLKPATGGTISAPIAPPAESSGTAYRSCTAPCYYTLSLGANDTLSAPFYDYYRDALYVGDDSGNLHQFFGVFNGTPAENTASPWPVHLGGNKLSSPVYDSEFGFQAGYIFVGDMGGVFYSVGSGYGGTTSGNIYGNTGSLGQAIADAPLVDCPQGVEYVSVTTNGSYSWTGYDAIWEFVSIFTNLGTPGVVPVGVGGTGYYLYAGAFDNVYFQSSPPFFASTGNIYVVGGTGTAGGGALYQVPISWSALTGASNVVATGLNSTEYPWPSPATEFCNGACTSPTPSGCTFTTNSTTVTCSSGGFSASDVGLSIAGTGIPAGATITAYTSPTVIKISADPSASETSPGVSLTVGVTNSGTDYLFFSVNRGAKTGCTNLAGHGCVLSYNITNPKSVTQAGSGLDITTPGTNGCWATGGIIIDNLSAAPGASQIYFANLNGNTAGGPTGATSSNCSAGSAANVNAVQAAQSNP